jgi:hypothetical protein
VSRRLGIAATVAVLMLLPTACGGGHSDADAGDPNAAGGFAAAADTTTSVNDATAVTTTADGYPAGFPLPAGTVVFNIEDRGPDGVIATGVTATPFDDALDAMNAAKKDGFEVTGGETEADDAEANWTGNGFIGRWAIKKSATCPGQTIIQLLAKKN